MAKRFNDRLNEQVLEWKQKADKWDEAKAVAVALDAKLTESLKNRVGFASKDFELASALLGALVDSAFAHEAPENGLVCSAVLSTGEEIFIEARRRRTGEPYVKSAEQWFEKAHILDALIQQWKTGLLSGQECMIEAATKVQMIGSKEATNV